MSDSDEPKAEPTKAICDTCGVVFSNFKRYGQTVLCANCDAQDPRTPEAVAVVLDAADVKINALTAELAAERAARVKAEEEASKVREVLMDTIDKTGVSDTELKPCPFCGLPASIRRGAFAYTGCEGHYLLFRLEKSDEEITREWNRRADSAQVEALKKEISALRIAFADASHTAGPTKVHVEALKARVAELEGAARAFTERLRVIHKDSKYMAVWESWQNHCGPYSGPQYAAELEALEAAISRATGGHKP